MKRGAALLRYNDGNKRDRKPEDRFANYIIDLSRKWSFCFFIQQSVTHPK